MSAAFTPGPWKADKPLSSSRRVFMPDDTVEIRDAGLQLVACLYRENLTGEADEANARLIAAAPEMFEALVELRRWKTQSHPDAGPAFAAADSALARARGEQP